MANTARDPQIIPDGMGGAIIAWGDGRNGKNDIYVQRMDSYGVPQWTPNGVELREAGVAK